MGSTQGTSQFTAPEPTIRRTSIEPTICILCLDRYQRERHSVCTCNHCSLTLCSDCMHDHIDELPNSIVQLSQQLHHLQEVYQSKQIMIDEEVTKSKTEISQCFKTYQNSLFEAHEAIIVDVEKAKHDAKEYLNKVASELHTIEADIESLRKETIFQPTRMEALLNQLNQIQMKIQNYNMTKESQLEIVLPKYSLKFQSNPPQTNGDTNLSSTTESANAPIIADRRSNRRLASHPYTRASSSAHRNHRLPENA